MNIFDLARLIIGRMSVRFRTVRQQNRLLKEARKQNPTCVLGFCQLNGSSFGEYVSILDYAYLQNVVIQDFSYVSNNSLLVNVQLGKFCSIGPFVQIGLAPHPSRVFVSTYPAFYKERFPGCPLSLRQDNIFDDRVPDTFIGSDVWIGANAIIPGGTQIGTGAIVAAGSVVVKDVPAYAIVGGNPAGIIRYRFTEKEIDELLESQWWDWPVEKIIKRVDDFSEIGRFVKSWRKDD